MFGLLIAPLYVGPNGRVLSWACYSTVVKTGWGRYKKLRVNRWWR